MKSKDELNQYAPWELEIKQEKKQLKKSIPPSNERARLFSRPKSKDHSHLEMYVLAREKERLEKYGSTLGRRVKTIASTWKEVKSKMYHLHKDSTSVGTEGIKELIKSEREEKEEKNKVKKGNMQKVDWDY